MSHPNCLRAEDLGRCAPLVLCPQTNGGQHCTLILSLNRSEFSLVDLGRWAPLVIRESSLLSSVNISMIHPVQIVSLKIIYCFYVFCNVFSSNTIPL